MGWIIVGDREHATFACDTDMMSFGPLHSNHGIGSAKKELQQFAETLDRDPRKLFVGENELQEKYNEWQNSNV